MSLEEGICRKMWGNNWQEDTKILLRQIFLKSKIVKKKYYMEDLIHGLNISSLKYIFIKNIP